MVVLLSACCMVTRRRSAAVLAAMLWWFWWWHFLLATAAAAETVLQPPKPSSSFSSSFSSSSSLISPVAGADRRRPVNSANGDEFVCSNIDIRNSVQQFEKKLTNCTVVEGFVQILLIDKATTEDFENLTFPRLREITGYLLLYRVLGLTSLSRLFPNLTVIKGQVLFHNYALVIFEMRSMQEIGLNNLTAIARGSVRIEKNSHLCYVDTIDWDHVTKAWRGGHFIKGNVPYEQCPNVCPSNCPVKTLPSGKHIKLCWNAHNCQKICKTECARQNLTCSTESRCCHQECIGGCTGGGSKDCIACKHVSYNGMCMLKCPAGTYEYLGRRCIREDECRAVTNQLAITPPTQTIHWKPFSRQCMAYCPAGFTENEHDKHTCKACKDRCPKVCDSAVVDSVASAQKLRGCTYIDGSLEIQIQGGDNVIKELEVSLSSIREIRGYLKIARSFPLISLNFLKDLTYIRGERLDKKDYAFLVLDNQNLQELWDWETRETKLHIGGGKIFFHFNSKLCPNKIGELKKYAEVMDWDDRDVSPSSNGDRVACNVVNVQISVWNMQCEVAGLTWKNFRKHHDNFDFRSLLGYVVYYREAPNRNVTKFDGRDACGSDVWKVDDVEALDDDVSGDVITIITQLKPYTTYAAYMRTYTIASALLGAESDIIYFTTKPFTPSPPVNVQASSPEHGVITVRWDQPKKPNGNVTHYIIDGIREKDLSEFITQRDYCAEPRAFHGIKNTPQTQLSSELDWFPNATSTPETKNSDKCCSCSKGSSLEVQEADAEFQIDFEDFLHNSVYLKNPDRSTRVNKKITKPIQFTTQKSTATPPSVWDMTKKPHLSSSQEHLPSEGSTEPSTTEGDANRPKENNENNFHFVISDNMFVVIRNLHHFTEYTIEVRACQDSKNETCNNAPECSTKAITTVRTRALGGADDIDESSIILNLDNATYGTVVIKWSEPKDPNGLIVTYHIEYKPAEARDYKAVPVCITQLEFSKKMGYTINGLMPGNYSLRLRATSLADEGNWTLPKYFVIPDIRDGVRHEVLVAVTIAAIAAVIIVVSGSIYFVRRKYSSRIPDGILYASVNPEYVSAGLVYKPDEWEVLREKITILEELGQGSFGMVYKGVVKGLKESNDLTPCAIKTVNDSASMRERIEFLQEASVMKAFSCHHIVKLLGVVSLGHPTLVIMELMSKGDLKAFLRSHRPDNEDPDVQPPTYRDILQMAVEIADGMAYLSAKKFVHRDLAARNCMVAEDYTVKIGDFGMTRDIYETDYYRKGGKGLLPVRWMAPECLKDGVFSCQSDIWSYGVVLWEMATFASQPYQGLANEQVLNYVISGRIMDKPENCPEKLYALMKLCWEYNPKARPTFTEIIEILLPDISESKFRGVSFYFTQRQETSVKESESIDVATSSTPLRMRPEVPNSREESDDDGDIQYFPPPRNVSDDNYICGNPTGGGMLSRDSFDLNEVRNSGGAIGGVSDGSKGYSVHSNEGSKNMSATSSDGSKGSKVSTVSNGSIANGHIPFALGRTTTC